jgi:Tfp pilus assembly protein PilF
MRARIPLAGAIFAAILAGRISSQTNTPQPKAASGTPGNEACSTCHSEIYGSYVKTVMAGASGPAGDGLITGEFDDKKSGVRYQVYKRDGRVWMSYEREGELRGERELLYFIGSGKKGRTYLFSDQGFLFEAPINWYSQESRWNMTPAYTEAREIPMNLPSFSSCLNCHTSGLQPRIAGTRNRFTGKPFLHDGITCERCHGEGEGHLGGTGPGAASSIVNPAKLPGERRDGICMECHFEGTAAVEQPGKRLHQFQPGDRLSDYVHYFVLAGNQPSTPEALSQFEALSLSACKRKSGDKMWCGTCHDSHREPGPAEKVAYYRGKCLSCHGKALAAKHHPDKPDCTQCHMPALPSKDVAHTQATDHRILRSPLGQQLPVKSAGQALQAFPESEAALVTTRDLALAWQMLAQRDVEGASHKAEEYLRKSVKESPDDPGLLSALAFVEQEHGRDNEARELYERTLKLRPRANTAATNLGILEARAGHLRRAVELWQGAFERVPYRSPIGMNLAMAFCAAGQKEDARRYVLRVLEFNPDLAKARQLLAHLDADPVQCKP